MSRLSESIPATSRPRERLLTQGAQALSDQELLAILLRTGTGQIHVMDLAALILHRYPSPVSYTHLTLPTICSV